MHGSRLLQIADDFAHRLILACGESKLEKSSNTSIDFRRHLDRPGLQSAIPDASSQRQPQLKLQQVIQQNSVSTGFPLLDRFRHVQPAQGGWQIWQTMCAAERFRHGVGDKFSKVLHRRARHSLHRVQLDAFGERIAWQNTGGRSEIIVRSQYGNAGTVEFPATCFLLRLATVNQMFVVAILFEHPWLIEP